MNEKAAMILTIKIFDCLMRHHTMTQTNFIVYEEIADMIVEAVERDAKQQQIASDPVSDDLSGAVETTGELENAANGS